MNLTKVLCLCVRTSKHQLITVRNISVGNLTGVFSNDSKLAFQNKLSTGIHSTAIRKVKLVENVGEASVLVPLCTVDGEPSMLFMVRPMTMPHHRGEVCFPGGKTDEDDHDLVHTALREAHEEIGLSEDKIDVWGMLGPVPSRKDGSIMVTPVVGYCGEVDLKSLVLNTHEVDLKALVLNTHEADLVFTRTIKSLCSNIRYTQYRHHLGTTRGYTLPVYCEGQHMYRIWGLTAIFVHQVLTLLLPELYTYKLIQR